MALVSIRAETHPGHYIRHQCYRCKIGDKGDEQSRKDASFFQRPGLAGGPGFISFEAEHFPGHYLRVRGGNEIWLDRHDGSEHFAREATFRIHPGFVNPMGVSLESLSHPGHFVREQGMMVNLSNEFFEHARRESTWHIEGAGGMPMPMPGAPVGYPGYAGAMPAAPAGYPGAAPAGYPGAAPAGYPGAAPAGYPGALPAAVGSLINAFASNFPTYELRHQCFRLKLSEPTESEQAKLDGQFRLQPSIAGFPGYFSLESGNFPQHYVKVRKGHHHEVWLEKFDGNPEFAREASFKLVPGLAGPSFWAFECLALPGHFLRHQGGHCFVHANDGSPLLAQDASWTIKQIGPAPAPAGYPSPYGAPAGMPSPYGAPGGAPSPYGAPGAPSPYGAPGAPSPYGAPGVAPSPYGAPGVAPSPYGAPPAYPGAPGAPPAYPGAPAGYPGYGAPAYPVAGAPGTQGMPGMPQVVSGGAYPRPY